MPGLQGPKLAEVSCKGHLHLHNSHLAQQPSSRSRCRRRQPQCVRDRQQTQAEVRAELPYPHSCQRRSTARSGARCQAGSAGFSQNFQESQGPATDVTPPPGPSKHGILQIAGVVTTAAVAAVGFYAWYTGRTANLQAAAGRTGLFPAFSLIFLSELGDKTFFIAGLLATSVGKWLSFIGSVSALSVMTIISVAIGYAFKSVPNALEGSLPVGKYLAVATMLWFGIRTLRDAWHMSSVRGEENDELLSAKDSIALARKTSKAAAPSAWQSFFEVVSLIFLAEWGDRSMLATIALAAAKSPTGVALGAVMGHVVATLIAVIFGAMAAQYFSEKTIAYTGGGLFVVFAAATALGVY